jgi:DNA-binding response OmpR family regulator
MKSLLLAHDNAAICGALADSLAGFGFQIQTAHTVESAVRLAQAAHFDAILVEFDLRSEQRAHPRIAAGLQVVRELRASGRCTPVLVLTAGEGKWCETAALEAGADDFLRTADGILLLVARLRARIRRNEQDSSD